MTASKKPEEAPEGPHPYFMAIEEVFLELRGSPLELSSADWHVAEGWYRSGIPLELVERTVRDLFARRRVLEDRKKKKKVWSLRYCKRSVEAAWRRQQELAAAGVAEVEASLDVAARLERLAASLPAGLASREAYGDRIRALAGDAESIEAALAEIDREVVASARSDLTPEASAAADRDLAAARSALAARLPGGELERSLEQLREQILRRHLGLPVLSLFSPEDSQEA